MSDREYRTYRARRRSPFRRPRMHSPPSPDAGWVSTGLLVVGCVALLGIIAWAVLS